MTDARHLSHQSSRGRDQGNPNRSSALFVEVIQASAQHIGDMSRCDGILLVTSELTLELADGVMGYSTVEVSPYEKKYSCASRDAINSGKQPDITFLAYVDGELAGQMNISRHWNNFAYINDIVVDHRLRRSGVGKRLLLRAIEWSEENSLAGLMLETQTNNVPACKLYDSCGFELKGFDANLYAGLSFGNNEIALYWYWTRPKQ